MYKFAIYCSGCVLSRKHLPSFTHFLSLNGLTFTTNVQFLTFRNIKGIACTDKDTPSSWSDSPFGEELIFRVMAASYSTNTNPTGTHSLFLSHTLHLISTFQMHYWLSVWTYPNTYSSIHTCIHRQSKTHLTVRNLTTTELWQRQLSWLRTALSRLITNIFFIPNLYKNTDWVIIYYALYLV